MRRRALLGNANNIIIYEASAKLTETPHQTNQGGIYISAFTGKNGNTLTITSHTFSNNTGIIVFNADVATIGGSAFYNSTSLISITIPNSVTSIGQSAFCNCSSLTSITIPNSVTSIGDYAFRGCSNLRSIIIGNGVTEIGRYVFQNCSSLASVTIGNSVTTIGQSAFDSCSGLTSITIPDSVTEIGTSAFYKCNGLTSVTFGSGLTYIGNSAFYYCTSLESITSNATTAPSISNSTFRNVKTGGTLHVPSGSTSSYRNSWLKTSSYYLGRYNWTISTI